MDSYIDLYNKYDASPLPCRYLNDDVEAYILQQMQHAGQNTKIALHFHLMSFPQKEYPQIGECGSGWSVYF